MAYSLLTGPCVSWQAIRSRYLSIDTFTPDNARKASPAAEGMCKWVHAMSSYDKACTPKISPDLRARGLNV